MSETPEPSSLCRSDCPPRAWPQSSDIQAGTVRALSPALVTQAQAAHVCYIAAGVLPQPWTPSAQFCLPGTDHRAHPRTFASVAALQASDILEWLMVQGGPTEAPRGLQRPLSKLWCGRVLQTTTVDCLLQAMATCALHHGQSASWRWSPLHADATTEHVEVAFPVRLVSIVSHGDLQQGRTLKRLNVQATHSSWHRRGCRTACCTRTAWLSTATSARPLRTACAWGRCTRSCTSPIRASWSPRL